MAIPKEIPDLKKVEIPGLEDKSGFEPDQRRADLYRRIMDAGGTNGLDETYQELGEEYGVSTSSIGDDVRIIRKYIIDKELNTEKIKEDVAGSLQWALQEAKSEGDYNAVPRILKQKMKFAQDVGSLEKSAEKHEIEHKGGMADKLAEIYSEERGSTDE